ncbi:hypothetical protein [Ligilactobacillus agilis]|nr:hypothetical protein [Ligilactobacillus agilis]
MTARRKVTSASHFGKKSVVDGYKFDSQKELDFYLRYIKSSGYEFEVQKNLVLVEVVVLRKNDFRVGVLGTTKKIETQARTNIDYEYSELIGDEN